MVPSFRFSIDLMGLIKDYPTTIEFALGALSHAYTLSASKDELTESSILLVLSNNDCSSHKGQLNSSPLSIFVLESYCNRDLWVRIRHELSLERVLNKTLGGEEQDLLRSRVSSSFRKFFQDVTTDYDTLELAALCWKPVDAYGQDDPCYLAIE